MESDKTSNDNVAARLLSPLAKALAGSKHYYAFLVMFVVVLSAQGSFVNDMYTPALPSMCKFFGCSIPLGQMGLAVGMIGLSIGQLSLGPLSDKYGRKPTLIVATAVFIVAAIVSIYSPTIHVFNLCRFFQGIGASAGYFLAKTIPADVYSGRQLAKFMAIVGAINGLAPASAPIAGGVLADNWGWKSIFIVLAGFAVVLILLSVKMKESLSPEVRNNGSVFTSFKIYGLIIRNRPFMIHTMLKGTALGLLFSYISSSPFIMQNHYGLSETVYGIFIGVNSLFLAAGSMLSLKFKPYRNAALAGAIIAAVGVVCLAAALFFINNLWIYDICAVIILFALGMLFSTSNTLAMNECRAHSGEAAAIIGVAGYIVSATVSPLVGMGNLMHSTAIVNLVLVVFVVGFAVASYKLPVDLDK